MLTIKFEDFEFTNHQATIKYYSNKNIKGKILQFQMISTINLLNSKALKRDKESLLRKQLKHQQERKLLDIIHLN